MLDVETGQTRLVYDKAVGETLTSDFPAVPTWSPNGRALLAFRTDNPGTDKQATDLRLIPVDGGEVRRIPLGAELTRLLSPGRGAQRPTVRDIVWSPDGGSLAFVVSSSRVETWVIENSGWRSRARRMRLRGSSVGQTSRRSRLFLGLLFALAVTTVEIASRLEAAAGRDAHAVVPQSEDPSGLPLIPHSDWTCISQRRRIIPSLPRSWRSVGGFSPKSACRPMAARRARAVINGRERSRTAGGWRVAFSAGPAGAMCPRFSIVRTARRSPGTDAPPRSRIR